MLAQEKLMKLKKKLIQYASLVEGMIDKSITGLLNKDKTILIDLIENDEPISNELELKIDKMCTALIARYQPAAKSLRIILMSLKINNDMERMADHAVNISERGLYLIEMPPIDIMSDIPKMAELTKSMLKDGINSFVNEDSKLAQDICERDDIIDELRDSITKKLIKVMCSDCANVPSSINLLIIARNLERIADLSTNIGEDVIFMVKGKVIKHQL